MEFEKLPTNTRYYLNNLSAPKLAGVLGGPLPDELTLDERQQACEVALTIFRTSPLFYPPPPPTINQT